MRDADDEVGVAPAPGHHGHLGGGVRVLQGGDEQPQLHPVPGVHDPTKLRLAAVIHHEARVRLRPGRGGCRSAQLTHSHGLDTEQEVRAVRRKRSEKALSHRNMCIIHGAGVSKFIWGFLDKRDVWMGELRVCLGLTQITNVSSILNSYVLFPVEVIIQNM